MRICWKLASTPLGSHAAWRERLESKNRRQGSSAPTLAAAWSGPTELVGALRKLPQFAELVLDRLDVEAESRFDEYDGPRNHDAVVHGHLPDGDRVVVCVEAKAGEPLGQTVKQYAKAAQKKLASGKPTQAPQRLDELLKKYTPGRDAADDTVRLLRYQLLSALAGTETEAAAAGAGADHAVLMIHEFLTDQRAKDKTAAHMADFTRFTTTVFECGHPGPSELPWCFEVRAPSSMHARLYLAWAVTDLRTATLET